MDIEAVSSLEQKQDQLPRIRQITRLDDVKRAMPVKLPVPISLKLSVQKKKSLGTYILIFSALVFIGIFIFGMAAVYKYDKLNKKLYDIAVKHKNDSERLSRTLKHENKINDILQSRKEGLTKNYINLLATYKILQYKMNKTVVDYSNILFEKSSFINLLKNKLYISETRISAWKAQNELLSSELQQKNEYVKKLTDKLVYNITQQEGLVRENLSLKKDREELLQRIALIETNLQKENPENKAR